MEQTKLSPDRTLPVSIVVSSIILAVTLIYVAGTKTFSPVVAENAAGEKGIATVAVNLEDEVLPKSGVTLPVQWGDFGRKLVESGVIDQKKFLALYEGRGGLSPEDEKLLLGTGNGNLRMTPENAGVILNLLWAFGLGQKSDVLDKGPMKDPRYNGAGPPAGGFASTGGWTIARGDAMEYYSKYQFVELSADEAALVERVAKNIYRPCCGNSTYFPDCNHGMAMLGLLELMASQGISEGDMYAAALQVNSYWFPDTYLTIASYFQAKGITWSAVDPKEALGADYSSGAGYQKIQSEVAAPPKRSGAGCGV